MTAFSTDLMLSIVIGSAKIPDHRCILFREILDNLVSRVKKDSASYFNEFSDFLKELYKDRHSLECLLSDRSLVETLVDNNLLDKENLKCFLNAFDCQTKWLLERALQVDSLIKRILNEFVLNKELVDRFNTIIENEDWCKNHNIHTIFDLIEYHNEDNEEVLKLNDLNRKVYRLNDFNLTTDEKLELVDVLKDNEQAQSLLKQLVDNHLEDQYKDFETLKNLLTKEDRKSLKTKFNF